MSVRREPIPVDECVVIGEVEHAGFGVAWLRLWCNAANLHPGEAQVEQACNQGHKGTLREEGRRTVDSFTVLVKTSC